MGIRIHKILGWGFRYTKGTNDIRFNNEVLCGDCQISKDEILNYINSENSLWKGFSKLFESELLRNMYDLYDFLHFGPDDLNRPFAIFALRGTDYYRYDDIIDHYDFPQSSGDKVTMIVDDANQATGIYPYYNFVNRNTGEKIDVYPSTRWTNTNRFIEVLKKEPSDLTKINEFISKQYGKQGINSLIEWQRHIGVEISPVLDALIELSNIFVDSRTKFRLKPMLVTYWS